MNREKILNLAIEYAYERDATHGDYTKQMLRSGQLLVSAGIIPVMHPNHAAMLACMTLALNKISRVLTGNPNNDDHWIDAASYIAKAGEFATSIDPIGGISDNKEPDKKSEPESVIDKVSELIKAATSK